MVSKIEKKENTIYICDKCGFGYKNYETAEKCEDYCTKHNSCSLELTKEAIYFPDDQSV